jgi:hypothetical protein
VMRPFFAKFILHGIFTMFTASGLKLSFLVLAAWGLFVFSAAAEEGLLSKAEPTGITSAEIIQRFAATEKEFAAAREQYGFRQAVKVQTLDGNTVDGEYQQTFDVSFDDSGHKIKTVVFAPAPTLQRIGMTSADFDDIENRLPFVLTSDEIDAYDILYVGQQQEDELHCYVFDIAPKKIEKKQRYFQGRIWVDDHDFQIVKTYGQTVPQIRGRKDENLFPKFTTWREQIDGKYWFPTYTYAQDTLHFSNQDVVIREVIKYTDYRKFGSKTKITYDGKEIGNARNGQPQDKPR